METSFDEKHYRAFHAQNGIPSDRNIYSELCAYRQQGAIVSEPAREGPAPEGGRWITADYETSLEILRRTDEFLGDVIVPSIWLALGTSLIFMEGEEHAALRRATRALFSKERLAEWEERIIRPAAHAVIDRFASQGKADLVSAFASGFPHLVLTKLMGFPEEDTDDARRSGIEILCATTDLGLALRASQRLTRCLRNMLAARRENPTNDLTTDVLNLEVDGRKLTEEEQLSFLRLLTPAGTETTYRAMANLLVGLLTNPLQLEAVRKDRSLIPQAVEEGLRWETPVLRTLRRTTCPVHLRGVELPAGAWINVNLGGANRDGRVFQDPDRFDIFRPRTPQLAFGLGPRQCLGAALARQEIRIGLEALLDRLPDLALDPSAEQPFVSGLLFRAALHVPAVWKT